MITSLLVYGNVHAMIRMPPCRRSCGCMYVVSSGMHLCTRIDL